MSTTSEATDIGAGPDRLDVEAGASSLGTIVVDVPPFDLYMRGADTLLLVSDVVVEELERRDSPPFVTARFSATVDEVVVGPSNADIDESLGRWSFTESVSYSEDALLGSAAAAELPYAYLVVRGGGVLAFVPRQPVSVMLVVGESDAEELIVLGSQPAEWRSAINFSEIARLLSRQPQYSGMSGDSVLQAWVSAAAGMNGDLGLSTIESALRSMGG